MLYFITSNKNKILGAHTYLDPFNIIFEPLNIELTEIQAESVEIVAQQKAKEVFAKVKKPLVVKDDGWIIPSLNGFPGPYMKYINQWFSTDDFLQLIKTKKDRKIIFHEVICYIDRNHLQMFVDNLEGIILDKPKGQGVPSTQLTTFRKDKKTFAECDNQKIPIAEERIIWNDFAKWYKKEIIK